jgi:hypothetical protein
MGKASSAKKVARAARAGGRVSSGQPRSLLFPGVLTLVIVLGTSLIVYARNDRNKDDLGGVPQLGDHIHMAISFVACGEFLPDLPEFESSIGIHTHGDGVMHIHPFSQLGVGANATLGRFIKDAHDDGELDVAVTNTSLSYLGEKYTEGKSKCDGVKNPTLRVGYWPNVGKADAKPDITTGDFSDLKITKDGGGITIFFGDPKADIPRPPNADKLAELGAADGSQTPDSSGNTTTSSVPSGSSTTAPAGEPSNTTVAPDAGSSTTVAP